MDKHEETPPRSLKQEQEPKEKQKKRKSKNRPAFKWKWALKAALISITVSVLLTLLSNEVLEKLNLFAAFVILIVFVAINIFFDIVSIAITTADIKPFLSMSARRLKVGINGVYLLNNAEKMTNIFADVIGDIAGVVSGSTGAAIVIKLFSDPDSEFIGNLIVTSLIAGITVGGKALGKSVGMKFSYNIVYGAAKIMSIFSRKKANDKRTANDGKSR